jgi:eukaryotic-like serine/threonine-protein kinase
MSDADSAIDPVAALAEDFVARYRRGERPALAEYTRQYPELSERIRQIFPLMALMEEAAPASEGSVAAAPARPAATTQSRPQQLGGYRILREIGRGGMGVVYEAEQLALRRRVALKVLPLHASREGKSLERFRREARAAARLHHTNIVPVYEVGEEDDICFYAMQYIDGQPLDQVVEELRAVRQTQVPEATRGDQPADANRTARRAVVRSLWSGTATIAAPAAGGDQSLQAAEFSLGPSAAGESDAASSPETSAILHTSPWHYHRNVARIGMEVAQALAYAHRDGVVHRDVKPSNLLLDSEGRVWITDFGLAKTDAEPLTGTGDLVGTLRYMPPERFRGWSDPRSDIYSLGLTLYEMLLLRPAFAENDQARLMQQIVNVDPPRLHKVDHHVPRDLATIVTKAIDKEPSRRYQTAGELAGDLQRFLEDRPILARQSGVLERSWRLCRRHRAVASLAASVLLLLVVIAAGASLSNLKLAGALQDVSNAEREARVKLFSAYRGQIRGSRFSRQVGQRFETLATVKKAVALAKELEEPPQTFEELRTHAIAALALPDLRPAGAWVREPDDPTQRHYASQIDPHFRVYAVPILDGGVQLYAVGAEQEGARELGRLPGPGRHPFWSPDGRYLALTTDDLVSVRKVELDGGKVKSSQVLQAPLLTPDYQTFAFSFDSRRFVLLQGDGKLWVFNLSDGSVLHQFKVPQGSGCLAHHPAQAQVALSCPDGIRILDVTTGQEVTRLHEMGPVGALAWQPDGARLAVGGIDTLRLWDVARRQPAWQMRHEGGGLLVAFNDTGRLLASTTWSSRARLWDPASGLELLRVTRARHYAPFGPENLLAVDFPEPNAGAVRQLAQVEVPRAFRTVRAGGPIGGVRNYHSAAVHPQGSLLAVGTEAGLSLFDLATGNEEAFLRLGPMQGVLFEPSGAALLTKTYGHGLLRWTIQEVPSPVNPPHTGNRGEMRLRIGPPERIAVPAHGDMIAQSRDGSVLAMPNGDGAYVWDRGQPRQGRWLRPHADCRGVDVSPDGRLVVTASHEIAGLRVWDARTGRLLQDLSKGGRTGRGYFTADGRLLVTAQGNCWRVPEAPGDLLAPWTEEPRLAADVTAVAPDRPLLAAAGPQGEVRLVHPRTGRVLASLEDPHQHGPYIVAKFSPDGARLAVASQEGLCVHIWNLAEVRRELALLELDWDGAPYPHSDPAPPPQVLRIDVDPGIYFSGVELTERIRDVSKTIPVIDWQRALTDVLQAIPKKPPRGSPAEADFQRAKTNYDKGLYKPALEDFTAALAADPNRVEAYHLRGHVQERLGRFDKARDDFSEAIKRTPNVPHFHARRGLAQMRLQAYDEARRDLERGRASKTDEAMVRHALAWLHLFGPAGMRDAAVAVAEAERAVELAPKNVEYLNTLGAAYYRTENYSKAILTLCRAQEGSKTDATALNRFFLAMSYHRQDDAAQAQVCYRQGLSWLKARSKLPRQELERLTSLREETAALLDGKPPPP